MADYRDMAAALSGGYGQDTGGITPDTLITLKNGKKATASDLLGMIKGYGQAVGSNLESLGRGGVASVIGAGGDLESLGRIGINKLYGAGGVNVSPTPVLPTSADILGMMPRATAPRQETAGMEELGGYMTPATAKVLKPMAKGVVRMAGQEINAAMTGQPTRSLLGTITPKPLQLDVYHGTPHTLPPTERNPLGEFDASKIGTGEGAQAYGYGIYTAEAPDVARGYANRLGSNLVMVDGKPMDFNDPVHLAASILSDPNNAGLPAKNLASAIRYDPKGIVPFGSESKAEEIAKVLESGNIPKFTNQKGNLYKIDLPDEKIATMLDWDKPVSQQKNVMNALRNEAEQRVKSNLLVNIENDIGSKLPVQDIGNDYMAMFSNQNVAINQDIRKQALEKLNQIDLQPLVEKELNTFKPLDMNWDMSGKDFYEILSTRSGSAQQASNILQQQGVAGIKYFDEGSRNLSNTWIVKHPQGGENVFASKESAEAFLKRNPDNTLIEPKVTRNFVVFPGEEKNMTILERNAKKNAK
jgi:hypothetical protein